MSFEKKHYKYFCCEEFKKFEEECGYFEVNLEDDESYSLVMIVVCKNWQTKVNVYEIFKYCPFCGIRIGNFKMAEEKRAEMNTGETG